MMRAVYRRLREETMQIILQVMARSSLRESLREQIISDLDDGEYELEITRERKRGRNPGWAKVKATGENGVMNIHWDAHSKTLTARAIGRRGNNPSKLVGLFIHYLLHKRPKDVIGITIRSM